MNKQMLAYCFSTLFLIFSQGVLAQNNEQPDLDNIVQPNMPDDTDSAVVDTPNLGSAAEDRRQNSDRIPEDRRQDAERRPEDLGRPERVGRPDTDNSAGGIGAGGRFERGNNNPGAGNPSSGRGDSGGGAGRGR